MNNILSRITQEEMRAKHQGKQLQQQQQQRPNNNLRGLSKCVKEMELH